MRTVEFTDEQLRTHYRACNLVEIQAGEGSSTFYRYTDWTSDVTATINGESRTFTRLPFVMVEILSTIDDVQNTQIAFSNQSQVVAGLSLANDFRDWPVKVWERRWSLDGTPQGTVLRIAGWLDGAEVDEEGTNSRIVLAVLSTRLPDQGMGPRQDYARTCRFRYKDEQCAAVSGFTTCNRTQQDCTVRNNLARFGGFPFAPLPRARFTWGPYQEIVEARAEVNYGGK